MLLLLSRFESVVLRVCMGESEARKHGVERECVMS